VIRVRRLSQNRLDAWLVDQGLAGTHATYRLRLWRDDATALPPLRRELHLYLDEAFEDAKRRLRAGFDDLLSPFNDPALDPAANYPAALHQVTLQGYFGETLAVLAVEHWGAAGHNDWQAPAFLFRFHDVEFQHLEQINQRIREGQNHDPNGPGQKRPGRTGDDGLAFRRDARQHITDVIALEAKCLGENRADIVREAHEKLARAGNLPSSIRELIELLSHYDTAEAQSWQESLIRFRAEGYRTARRYDGIAYATGNRPARAARLSWLPANQPHTSYTANRHLAAFEFQFAELDNLIDSLYRRTR
jgi:hypothetical protein